MLSKEELILLHHYLKEGLAKTTIATKLGISRHTSFSSWVTPTATMIWSSLTTAWTL
jgi:hypothetical protein